MNQKKSTAAGLLLLLCSACVSDVDHDIQPAKPVVQSVTESEDQAEGPVKSNEEQKTSSVIVGGKTATDPVFPGSPKIQSPTETKALTSLADITDFLVPEATKFKISPDKDTLIVCPKGTKLYLPANTLQFADGSAPTEKVELKVQEFYSIADFAGGNLSTKSGSQILETGGMLHILASSNGEPLKMKPGKEYALYFPKDVEKEGMELFYGNHDEAGTVDWIQAKSDNPEIEMIKLPSTCKIYAGRHTSGIGKEPVDWKIKDTKTTLLDYFESEFVQPENVNAFCANNYGLDIKVKLDNQGKFSEIKIVKSSAPEFDKLIIDFLYAMPNLDTKSMGGYTPSQQYDLGFMGKTSIDKGLYKAQFEEKYASFKSQAIDQINSSELDNYVLTASRFGWINCDRFQNSKAPRTDFVVNTASPNDTRIIIAFKDVRSLMQSQLVNGRVTFANIPVNQAVRVIGISYENGKPRLAVAETTISKSSFELSGFKDFTLDELEAQLNSL